MIPIEQYWCKDKPTLEDIQYAYNQASRGIVIEIRWFVSGRNSILVTPDDIKDMDAETYFNEMIPVVITKEEVLACYNKWVKGEGE